jgi:hypothetical protein
MQETQRIKGVEESKAPFSVKPLFMASRKILGKVVEPLKVMARRPSIAWFGNLLGVAIEKSGTIEARIHILAQLRAAQIVECPF